LLGNSISFNDYLAFQVPLCKPLNLHGSEGIDLEFDAIRQFEYLVVGLLNIFLG
jgi:hypothetical protein